MNEFINISDYYSGSNLSPFKSVVMYEKNAILAESLPRVILSIFNELTSNMLSGLDRFIGFYERRLDLS